jgi:hypothetical protein
MTSPVRLRLSRAKGFNLQALSLRTNGLVARSVARPGRWGNPFAIGRCVQGRTAPDAKGAVGLFEAMLHDRQLREACHYPSLNRIQSGEISGINLACFCPLDQPCHADVLLRLANPDHFVDANKKAEAEE